MPRKVRVKKEVKGEKPIHKGAKERKTRKTRKTRKKRQCPKYQYMKAGKCVPSFGAKLKRGTLRQYGYSSSDPPAVRRAALKRAIRALNAQGRNGELVVQRKLQAVCNLGHKKEICTDAQRAKLARKTRKVRKSRKVNSER